jgi:hypothetical protein
MMSCRLVASDHPVLNLKPLFLENQTREETEVMKLSDLSQKGFKELVNGMVDDRLCELLGDPDLGLPLDETVRARLKESLASSERMTGDEIAEQLGLRW